MDYDISYSGFINRHRGLKRNLKSENGSTDESVAVSLQINHTGLVGFVKSHPEI